MNSTPGKTTTRGGKRNYYLTLDISPGVSHNDILHAYSRAKQAYSGNSLAAYSLLDDDTADSILTEIEEAFAVLGDPARRRKYDLDMGFDTWKESEEKVSGDGIQMIRSPGQGGGTQIIAPSSTPASSEKPSSTVREQRPVKLEAVPSNGMRFEANTEFEAKIEQCTSVTGEFMRAVRIYRQWTEEQLAQRCRLSGAHVRTIENEDGDAMQSSVYLRGHVEMLCRELQLPEPRALARGFVERMFTENKLPRTPF